MWSFVAYMYVYIFDVRGFFLLFRFRTKTSKKCLFHSALFDEKYAFSFHDFQIIHSQENAIVFV